ncbi:EamA family transporter [bacterium]|nr:EamA family transporter [bacterium]
MKGSAIIVLLALLAASIEPILVKLGYRGSVTPLQLLVMKNIVAAVVILPMTRHFRLVKYTDAFRIGSVSILLLCTNGLTLFALKYLSAVEVITIVTTTPAIVAITNWALGRDALNWKFWLGFVMCFVGVLLTVDVFGMNGVSTHSLLGYLAIAGAVVSSTVYRVRMESLTGDFAPPLISTWVFWINALVAVLFIWPFQDPFPRESLGIGLWIGLAAAAANVAFLWAIKLVGSTNMSIFNLLQRPLVIVAASLILSDPMSLTQWIGVALVLGGIPLARIKKKK